MHYKLYIPDAVVFQEIIDLLKSHSISIALADENVIIPHVSWHLNPFLFSITMQLLAYYTALFKGTDVDQPRNLAKSVTVE